jgi:hypothetical protein
MNYRVIIFSVFENTIALADGNWLHTVVDKGRITPVHSDG